MAKCIRCQCELKPGAPFCVSCGATQAAPTPALRREGAEANAPLACFIVFASCGVLSYIGWIPLALPALAVGAIIPRGYCSSLQVKTVEMYLCSMKVAIQQMIGPLLVVAALFFLRKAIVTQVDGLLRRLPSPYRFVGAPLVAAAAFTMAWGAVHFETADQTGFVSQRLFPAVVGLYTYCTGRFGPTVQQKWPAFFRWRDTFPHWMRMAALFFAPLLLSLIITAQSRVTQSALKEQFVVMVSMCGGYLMLTPRSTEVR